MSSLLKNMAGNSCMNYYALALCCLSWLLSTAVAQSGRPNLPLKAANLGGWLVTEGWMTPSLFDGITNKDLLDGTQVQFRSTKLNKYLAAENGGGSSLVANRDSASGWETFRLWRIDQSSFNFRVFNRQLIGLDNQGSNVVAVSSTPAAAETFRIVRKDDDPLRVRIRASNGQFLQANTESSVAADYGGSSDWGDDNPSVFQMVIVNTMTGEYQLSNGLGPDKAQQVLRDHWSSYTVEDDFRFMSANGLNAVRIPVGWWITYDQTPPSPFVGGSLQALDNAFTWAGNHNMKVIVDLHGVPGGQNEDSHCGSRDGYIEWGSSRIQETVDVIDFLARRYANNPALGAIELMNEPRAPDVTLDDLSNYYKTGYDAVRKYTSSAYVILSNRLGPANSKELLSLAGGLDGAVIDVHYYNLYTDQFNNMNAQQNIDYIYNDRAAQLREISQPNGPLIFVGEWTAAWNVNNAPPQDYERYAQAQVDVYGNTSFGWAYWSYKNLYDLWSLQWMLQNNHIKV